MGAIQSNANYVFRRQTLKSHVDNNIRILMFNIYFHLADELLDTLYVW